MKDPIIQMKFCRQHLISVFIFYHILAYNHAPLTWTENSHSYMEFLVNFIKATWRGALSEWVVTTCERIYASIFLDPLLYSVLCNQDCRLDKINEMDDWVQSYCDNRCLWIVRWRKWNSESGFNCLLRIGRINILEVIPAVEKMPPEELASVGGFHCTTLISERNHFYDMETGFTKSKIKPASTKSGLVLSSTGTSRYLFQSLMRSAWFYNLVP